MDLKKKQAILASIKEDIAKVWALPCSAWLDNLGSVFFMSGASFRTLDEFKQLVYDLYFKYEIKIEFMDLDTHRFIGTEPHAKALLEAFGGKCWHDQIFYSKNAQHQSAPQGWISADFWQGSIYDLDVQKEPTFNEKKAVEEALPLSMEDVITAIF